MERRYSLVVVASLVFGILGWFHDRIPAAADEPVAAEAKETRKQSGRVALVDLGRVFKESDQFNAGREALKVELAKTETEAQVMAAEIQRLETKSKQLTAGTNEHDAATDELALKKQTFDAYRKQVQRQFAKTEANLYVKIYEMVRDHIKKYADANGIDLVIRYSAEEADLKQPRTPQQSLQLLNQQVVYHKSLDITDQIVQAVNGRLASARY